MKTNQKVENTYQRPSLVEQHKMKDIIETFDEQQYAEMFKIIQKHSSEYSQNSNGIFINFKHISDVALCEIQKYVDYIKQTNSTLDARQCEDIKSSLKK